MWSCVAGQVLYDVSKERSAVIKAQAHEEKSSKLAP
jgi:hypothetical protein